MLAIGIFDKVFAFLAGNIDSGGGVWAKSPRKAWGEGEMVRTERSNLNRIVVHFFETRQRNEPKKTFVRALPLRIPLVVACYTQKMLSHFLLRRTRLMPSADFAFAASKRTAKTTGFPTVCHL